ncbi:ATP-binding protein [Candidatus Pacebacteria bacterium]|nr:ATP-binding protein [Candidatus Paceibacterota bacterium]
MAEKTENFNFEISLSVLNHLGRSLYRNFITVLGEAVSNAWDADAKNVWIFIDRENNHFVIKDDGIGMDAEDFKEKFLKVGYSKRADGKVKSDKDRPYIGAKGIGKLALLSCAEVVSIVSKKTGGDYVGGVIDNGGLDEAIKEQLTPSEYELGQVDWTLFDQYIKDHDNGTIIYFENTKESIRNTIPHLKKLIALYFKFSLIDPEFTIHVNGEPVTLADIKDLADATQFGWKINDLEDSYVSENLINLKQDAAEISIPEFNAVGFIASVEKPRFLKISGTEEKVGIDLFVNGRLREKDILKHLPDFSTRHVASYLYGQIHCDALDTGVNEDAFTSSREGVVADNEEYSTLLNVLKESILNRISNEWDLWRFEIDETGDEDNPQKSKKERFARGLFKESADGYSGTGNDNVGGWIKDLREDAEFNVPAYVDCFLSENLIRRYLSENGISTAPEQTEIDKWRRVETSGKAVANLQIDIRHSNDDIYYLSMLPLARLAEPPRGGTQDRLLTDEKQFTPIRNGVMHTARLTDEAKRKLTTVYDNIRAKVRNLLSGT